MTQEKLDTYPRYLLEEKKYKKRSVNTIVVSTRAFCHTMGWDDLHISGYSLELTERKSMDKHISRSDYQKLVTTALARKDYRMAMIIQTLCHMDIRYSELEGLTVEAVRKGVVTVTRRKKTFNMEIPQYLAESLLLYADKSGVTNGVIFSTATGRPVDRSNIWREVKMHCLRAGLDDSRINMQKLKMPLVRDYYPFYPMEGNDKEVMK